ALGTAYGFAIAYGAYAVMMAVVARRLIRYSHSSQVKRQLTISAIFVTLSFTSLLLADGLWGSLIAGTFAAVAGVLSIRGIFVRASGKNTLSILSKIKRTSAQFKET